MLFAKKTFHSIDEIYFDMHAFDCGQVVWEGLISWDEGVGAFFGGLSWLSIVRRLAFRSCLSCGPAFFSRSLLFILACRFGAIFDSQRI